MLRPSFSNSHQVQGYFLHGPRSCLQTYSENLQFRGVFGVLVYFPPGVSALGQSVAIDVLVMVHSYM